jgi:hypothetical protein
MTGQVQHMKALRLQRRPQLRERAAVQDADVGPIVAASRLDRVQNPPELGLIIKQLATLTLVGAANHHQYPQGAGNLDRRGRAQPGDRPVQRHPRVQHQRPGHEFGQHQRLPRKVRQPVASKGSPLGDFAMRERLK